MKITLQQRSYHNTFSLSLKMVAFLLIISAKLFGQGNLGGESDRIDKTKFIPLPYFDYDRAIGYTVGALPMLMFNPSKKDSISPSSTVGLMGMYSENKSKFFMGFGSFYLQEDRWRIIVAAGVGDGNFQFYVNNPINKWFKYRTGADFIFTSINRRIIPRLYGGINYVYSTFQTNAEGLEEEDPVVLQGLGVEMSWDRRGSIQYPRSGYYLEADLMTYPEFLGNDGKSSLITFTYNHYYPTRNNTDVIATRFYTGLGIGEVNFNHQFIVGETDIRGYSFGQYRGNYILATQGEYRWNFHKRFGVVGFVGLATVFGSDNPEFDGRLLPGVGTGFRYTYLKKTHSNIGFDIAKGDGDWGFYFRISEAF